MRDIPINTYPDEVARKWKSERDEFESLLAHKDAQIAELGEHLRKTILWAESMYGKWVSNTDRDANPVNWTTLEAARQALAAPQNVSHSIQNDTPAQNEKHREFPEKEFRAWLFSEEGFRSTPEIARWAWDEAMK